MSLTWRDNANNETGFVVERCSFVAPATTCTQLRADRRARTEDNTGNVTYIDTTVTGGNSYRYRVAAFNAGGTSAFVTLATAVAIQAIPAAPTSFTVVGRSKANGNNYTATLTWTLATGRPQSDQLHDPACHQPRLHDGPDAPSRLRAPPGV